jgi:hypothetical protein
MSNQPRLISLVGASFWEISELSDVEAFGAVARQLPRQRPPKDAEALLALPWIAGLLFGNNAGSSVALKHVRPTLIQASQRLAATASGVAALGTFLSFGSFGCANVGDDFSTARAGGRQ